MQIVYISNRYETLLETVKQVALFMPFVNRITVLAPTWAKDISLFEKFSDSKIVLESELFSDQELRWLGTADHQSRNYFLRSKLIHSEFVDDQFIMSDDDSRPLTDVPITTFLENGKYHRYYFYQLADWNNHRTEFDKGQLSTRAILNQHGLPQYAYASHMPQIIDKSLFIETAAFFRRYSDTQPICEWSSYFNYAPHIAEEKFHAPSPYVTLCWPEHPLAWRVAKRPSKYLFENFSPQLYSNGGVFAEFAKHKTGIDETAEQTQQANVSKILKWEQHVLSTLFPEQGHGMAKYLNWRTWFNKATNHLKLRR